jgi:AcrR family transcriptional regulator
MRRLGSTERRAAIIDAALPLFARKGFAATTTKEIAQAAGVSEALIFKHFPSKAALHEAMFQCCVEGDGALARLLAMEPGTAAVVAYVRAMVSYYALGIPACPENLLPRHRLLIMSLLEDGEFARLARRWMSEHILPSFVSSLRAAQAAGDLVPTATVPENAFWLAEMLGAMLATVRLPDDPVIPSLCDHEATARQTIHFILRGLGLKDEVIAAYTQPDAVDSEPSCLREGNRDQ